MNTARQYSTFRLAENWYAVDVLQVQEIIRPQEMTRVPLASPVVSGLINLRGQLVTALDLRRRLDLAPRTDGREPMNVVIRTAEGPVSLLVDEIGDVFEIDSKDLEVPPETVEPGLRALLTSVARLDGRLLLLLDLEAVMELSPA
ncbi:chemotaxis protein CheW [Opitutales bacterium ASA1]|jgi:purine-binding chemotaxis protein CheW|uniref:chemotaxis protein CheW n=1 Tax=Congregicoccus parvus TaxID=3081749 RepID=UPI002B315129|nr:chemotaxis protein CheW [Opitutales bacterium ASA1]